MRDLVVVAGVAAARVDDRVGALPMDDSPTQAKARLTPRSVSGEGGEVPPWPITA